MSADAALLVTLLQRRAAGDASDARHFAETGRPGKAVYCQKQAAALYARSRES